MSATSFETLGVSPDLCAALAAQGIELPTFASPTVPGVTLTDTDQVYGIYRERMLEAQRRQLPAFQAAMQG